jgi:hypothetical protein
MGLHASSAMTTHAAAHQPPRPRRTGSLFRAQEPKSTSTNAPPLEERGLDRAAQRDSTARGKSAARPLIN